MVLEQCQNHAEASVAMERRFTEFLFDLDLNVEQMLLVRVRGPLREGSQQRRQRDRRVRNRQKKRVDMPVFEVMKRDWLSTPSDLNPPSPLLPISPQKLVTLSPLSLPQKNVSQAGDAFTGKKH